MHPIEVVYRKEIVDNLRDRRSLSAALTTPLLGPVLLFASFFLIADIQQQVEHPTVPLAGRAHAPELVAYLESQGVTFTAPPDDPKTAVATLVADVVMVVPPDFDAALRSGQPAFVELVGDSTVTRAGATMNRLTALIEGYGSQVGALRLQLRGIDVGLMRAIAVEHVEVARPQAAAAGVLAILPMMLILACFVGGMYVALDGTAGERERQSLEPLLYQPVGAFEVVMGKALATWSFSVVSIVVTIVAFAIALPNMPLEKLGLSPELNLATIVQLLLLVLPLAAVGSAALLVVGLLSKSFRTAQAIVSVLVLGPALPGMITTLVPMHPKFPIVLVPALGETLLATRLMRGEHIELVQQAALAATELGLAALLLVFAARLFGPRLLND